MGVQEKSKLQTQGLDSWASEVSVYPLWVKQMPHLLAVHQQTGGCSTSFSTVNYLLSRRIYAICKFPSLFYSYVGWSSQEPWCYALARVCRYHLDWLHLKISHKHGRMETGSQLQDGRSLCTAVIRFQNKLSGYFMQSSVLKPFACLLIKIGKLWTLYMRYNTSSTLPASSFLFGSVSPIESAMAMDSITWLIADLLLLKNILFALQAQL